MTFKMIRKEFKLVGLKGIGKYADFGEEVPKLAKQLLSRSTEIESSTEEEIGLFEPKRDTAHATGNFYVGLIVLEKIDKLPIGMEYMETHNNYITTRGNIKDLEQLHKNLLDWGQEQGYKRDLDSYIIETYHPVSEGEEVEIYLPVKA